MRILLIEDDAEAAAHLAKNLRESGHVIDHAVDGDVGLKMAKAGDYDAYVIDRMLPKLDGVSILTRRRDDGDETPALFLSALGEVDDRVTGLKAGGDDYLVKPYAFPELLARVEALGRRRTQPANVTTRYVVGDLEIDVITRTARRGDRKIELQPREFRLLEYLMRHADQVVTLTMLLENVWEYHFDPQTNVIDVHISRLRSKIDKDFPKPLLKTIRGAGYSITNKD
ncbi:MAG: response regulator transcription factor [Parvularculaceae bacterium]